MVDNGEGTNTPISVNPRILAYKSKNNDSIVFFDTERGDISARTTFNPGHTFCFWKDKLCIVKNGKVAMVDCPYLSQDNTKNYLPYYKEVKDEFFGLLRD